MKNAALVLKPLTDALRGASRQKAVEWTAQMERAFAAIKEMMVRATCLAHPHRDTQLVLLRMPLGPTWERPCSSR